MVYYTLFAAIALGGFAEQFFVYRKNGKVALYYFVFLCSVIFILGALRWERGTDWYSFYSYFLNPWYHWDQHYEIGYATLNKMIRSVTDNYSILLAVQTGIYLFIVNKQYKTINAWFLNKRLMLSTLLLYQYASEFAGLFSTRSQIAGVICGLALLEIREQKFLRFIVLVFFAATFHTSALSFLLAYPIYHTVKKTLLLYAGIFSSTVLAMLYHGTIIQAMSAIPFLNRYTNYISETSGDLTMGLLKWLILSLIFFTLNFINKDENMERFMRIFTVGVAIYFWSLYYGPVFNRLAGIFLGTALPLIVYSMNTFHGKNRMLAYSVYIMMCFLIFYATLNGHYHLLYEPYKSIFDDFGVVTQVDG